MCKHYDCQYYCPETGTCDYMLITGSPRPCPPTDDCTEHCTDVSKMVIVKTRYTPRVVDLAAVRRMEQVYYENMRTEELAKLARVPRKEALYWTRKVHPESIVFESGQKRMRG